MSEPAAAAVDWEAVPRKGEGLVTRLIADETVVVPVRGQLAQLQNVYVLTPVGAFLWDRIDGRVDVRALHGALLAEYDVSPEVAEADLFEFLAAMRAAGLMSLDVPSPPEAP